MPGQEKICSMITAPPRIEGNVQPDQCDQRNQRVAESVMHEHPHRTDSLGPRRADVVLPDHFLQVGMHKAALVGQAAIGEAYHRHQTMLK